MTTATMLFENGFPVDGGGATGCAGATCADQHEREAGKRAMNVERCCHRRTLVQESAAGTDWTGACSLAPGVAGSVLEMILDFLHQEAPGRVLAGSAGLLHRDL
jgi:hypothetical protein